jgi:1-acyl-sn-glycerol-3-phosphate acyltransferase
MECSNPFVHTLDLPLIQKVKILLFGVTLLPIRLCFALICLTLTSLLAYIGLYGLSIEDINRTSFTGWRLYCRKVICGILRIMFFVCGFHYVKVIGKQASPSEARILCVAPHSSFFDALAVIMMDAPSVVAKADTSSIPFWGSLIKLTQPVLVHRNDPNSRQNTIKHIKERSCSENDWQQVLIYPEGTCTNRSSYITFRPGAFLPGVAVQPVIIRYDNNYDTVTWTWEGFPAWKVIVYSLSQFHINCSIEFMDPYIPSHEEIADAKLFANNVRQVMAKKVGIPTTDCNYFDYLRIEKSKRRCRALQKLQRKFDTSLLDMTNFVEDIAEDGVANESAKVELCERLGVSVEMVEVNTVVECLVLEETVGGEGDSVSLFDLRDLRLAILVATSTDGLNTLLDNCFRLFDRSLGDASIAKVTCTKILQKHLFLSSKEANEVSESLHECEVIMKSDLIAYITVTKPNHLKVLKAAEDTLIVNMTDLLAKTAGLTAERMAAKLEKYAASGSSLVSDMSATVAAGREKVSVVLTSAASSLHKRMDSYSEKKKE